MAVVGYMIQLLHIQWMYLAVPILCLNSSTVAHADRTELILHADHKGFGFNMGSTHASDIMTTPPIVSNIDRGSPAERSGALQIGDRILAINGESTEGMSIEKITNMISNSHPRISFIIEFDVAEAVVPSSGSIAHRTGTIQPGDKLLAINSIRTENCTIEDATAILHTCTDIVKLRIRKDETFSEDPDATCAIVYTVELVRHGGPLGITVSGTKEPFDPIFISGLTENGLAERTGALHVGDRILAINGNSLRGKTLNEAICILQTCGDTVTLKISKCPCLEKSEDGNSKLKGIHCLPDSHMKTFSIPLSSADSAVDSWDSCNPRLPPDIAHTESDEYSHSSNQNVSISYPNTLEQSRCRTTERDNKPIFWNQKIPRPNSYSGNHSIPSEEEKESWHKVLEDLQTCGESRLLRQLEQSILGIDKNDNEEESISDENAENSLKHSVYNETSNFVCNPSSSYSVPLPIEIQKHSTGWPADASGLIKPLDRILQVNNVKTYNAGLIVPLIASSGDRIELVISRPSFDDELSSESTLERSRNSNYNTWDDDEDGDKSRQYISILSNTRNQDFHKNFIKLLV
ncbi:glutamate receptor-interacting protein 1 [Caerostris extrusa]|uniref:Glutamate receptor-interacting protein 1 n=1 Tax=Caerostris extrusa TaxID=172846 RepID=A0AAV4PE46_CAEEX|nr:glutamate receptor-interacting protein 1 [Caerostris extrusa]